MFLCRGQGEGQNYTITIGSKSFENVAKHKYSHAPHNDVSVNDGPHIRRWSYKIII